MRLYETTMVIDSFLKSEDMQNLVNKIRNFIKNNGGEIRKVEEWGKRRLAYEINRKQYGNYFHILFEGPNSLPQLLEREYRLEESILRYLTVLTDPKILAIKEKKPPLKKQIETSPKPSIPDVIADEDFSFSVDDELGTAEVKDTDDQAVKDKKDTEE
ncbi:MAG: 30S ribosomal protein S6 [bacterium]